MVVFDYCAMAREDYDGAISGPADRREGGLTALKTSVMVVYGIDDDPEEGLLRCAGKKMSYGRTRHEEACVADLQAAGRFWHWTAED